MFYETDDGRFINLDMVRTVTVRKTSKRISTLTFVFQDGAHITAEEYGHPNFADLACSAISAQPGFERLTYWFHDETPPTVEDICAHFNRVPIIGWKVGRYTPEPITPDDPTEPTNGVAAILLPTGGVLEPDEAFFASLEDWANAVIERWHKWKARQAESVKQPDESTAPQSAS